MTIIFQIDDCDLDLVPDLEKLRIYQGNLSYTKPHKEDGVLTGLLVSRAVFFRMGFDLRKKVKFNNGDKLDLRRENISAKGRVLLCDGVLLDEDLQQLLEQSSYSLNSNGYIRKSGYHEGLSVKNPYLHQVVWFEKNGLIPTNLTIDHKNRNKLDNRIENLRLADRFQQALNKTNNTKTHGIVFVPKRSSYQVYGSYRTEKGSKKKFLGYHKDLETAQRIRDEFYHQTLSDEDLEFFIPNVSII